MTYISTFFVVFIFLYYLLRFEKLDITPKSAQKIKPVLERWMKEAEERFVLLAYLLLLRRINFFHTCYLVATETPNNFK